MMRISNFAIINSLEVGFGPKLNVFTGETGAGKSIIFEALHLTLGGRATPGLVRSGAKDATVESFFELPATLGGQAARGILEGAGIDVPPDGEFIVRRRISTSGRSRIYLNGALSTAGTLTSISDYLVNIHGQHAQQTLLKPSAHLNLVDNFGGLDNERKALGCLISKMTAAKEKLEAYQKNSQARAQQADLLRFQVEEIENADLTPGEAKSIEAELPRLRNAERLGSLSQGIYEELYGAEGSVIEQLGECLRKLERLIELDPSQAPLLDRATSTRTEIESLADSIRDYFGGTEIDPGRLEAFETRSALLREIIRKYGNDEAECIAYLGRVRSELDTLSCEEGSKPHLEEAARNLQEEVAHHSIALSNQRREASAQLDMRMRENLAELGLEGAILETRLNHQFDSAGNFKINGKKVQLRSDGIDICEFHFSPNTGEPPRPLARIASGGELSRLMLAFESVLRRGNLIPTLIFDEVDAGIGGRVAEVVGRKLQEVSSNHQVLVITHLPQVACLGDCHFRINKHTAAGRTLTSIEPIEGNERIKEIARMSAGLNVTGAAIKHATEMLAAGKRTSLRHVSSTHPKPTPR